ncbi:hypothetical protein Spb1_14860 [Planctopirus ephydatiae]|uniref:Uncharacterized protein n=1 Tax=Planctopirus ephydatiae TaxID=2528019 RepID=A0A518GLZ2_9PLAN|nr:hypothetical protein [Planctopirus ephydatiae]QDV29574.1 hypothetical protein Spb1_14860 [Planctopirus ephydatiae]
MTMPIILRFTGDGPPPVTDLHRLHTMENCKVLEVAGRMVLLQADQLSTEVLHGLFPEWTVANMANAADPPQPHPNPKVIISSPGESQ